MKTKIIRLECGCEIKRVRDGAHFEESLRRCDGHLRAMAVHPSAGIGG